MYQNSPAPAAEGDQPISPVESARRDLAIAQEHQAARLQELGRRLLPALRDHVPSIGSNKTDAPPSPLIQSEIHGHLVAAYDKTCATTTVINDLLDRLTF